MASVRLLIYSIYVSEHDYLYYMEWFLNEQGTNKATSWQYCNNCGTPCLYAANNETRDAKGVCQAGGGGVCGWRAEEKMCGSFSFAEGSFVCGCTSQ